MGYKKMNNKQCAYWSLTINEKAKCFNDISNILNDLEEKNPNIEYSYILHNADDDDKNLHYHLVLYFKGQVKRYNTIFNIFEGAHIEQTNKARYYRCIQYLIHKNNPEKQQYTLDEVITNIETSLFNDIMGGTGYVYELFDINKTYQYLNEYMAQGIVPSIEEFANRFGLGALNKDYFMLKDIIKEFNTQNNLLISTYKQINNLSISEFLFKSMQGDILKEYYEARCNGCYLSFEEWSDIKYREFIDQVNNGVVDSGKAFANYLNGHR